MGLYRDGDCARIPPVTLKASRHPVGGLNGFVWIVPVAGALAAIGMARPNRTELPIHDRQTDVIVGSWVWCWPPLLQGVLLQRYGLYFDLLRLDLVALWLFVISASVALFGLRPIIRFGWAWLILLDGVPVTVLPDRDPAGWQSRAAAGVGTMIIAATATATDVAVGRRTSRRDGPGSNAAWLVGLAHPGGDGDLLPRRTAAGLSVHPGVDLDLSWSAP